MKIISTVKEMQVFSERIRNAGKRIAFVPTMGFFHEGHLSLIREGRKQGDILVVSIFVNPAQFGPSEDLEQYPKDFDRDCHDAEELGTDVVFAPTVSEIYPDGFQTYVKVEEITRPLCGNSRPVHFRGVTTVVSKLFNIVKPHTAIFGEKDFQQLVAIKQMVRDLNIDVQIVGMPTVREQDGLAMSSRNTYLNEDDRRAALSLSQSLFLAQALFEKGERQSEVILQKVKELLQKEPSVLIEYAEIRNVHDLEEVVLIEQDAVLALAARVGKTRLIDNCVLKTKSATN